MADKVLSVFIDESGDFGAYEPHAPMYLVTMVLHDQSVDISDQIRGLNEYIRDLGYCDHAIHTGPLIRRESIYENEYVEARRKLFNTLFNFTRKLNIHYICTKVDKSECSDIIQLTARVSKAIAKALRDTESFWNQYDNVIVYYDNGQVELTKILTSVFHTLYAHVEFRKVAPVNYKLFQVADLICTLELLRAKGEKGNFSKSETDFFHSFRDFRKNYLRAIDQKKLF